MTAQRDELECCVCGHPLHYPNAETEAYVRAQILRDGPTVNVTSATGAFTVPRHYLVLHGIPERLAMVRLAKQYHFARVRRTKGTAH